MMNVPSGEDVWSDVALPGEEVPSGSTTVMTVKVTLAFYTYCCHSVSALRLDNADDSGWVFRDGVKIHIFLPCRKKVNRKGGGLRQVSA